MKLVLVAHRRRAAFQIADITFFLGDDQRPLELAGLGRVDAEIGRKLHRAAHALRDVAEGTVGKDGGVERRIVIIRIGHDRAHIFLHQLGMIAHGLGNRAEDHAFLLQPVLEGGGDGDTVEHSIDGDVMRALDTGKDFLLLQRDTEFLVDFQKFRIDLVEAFRLVLLLRRGIVIDVLKIDLRIMDIRPFRLDHGQPVAIGLQTPFQEPFRLFLFRGNEADDILVQADRRGIGRDIAEKAVFIFVGNSGDLIDGFSGNSHKFTPLEVGRRATGSRAPSVQSLHSSCHRTCRPMSRLRARY